MSAKIISTYIAGGYSLNSKYSQLTITAAGGIGGTGLYAGAYARVVNDGVVHGHYADGMDLHAGGSVQNGDGNVTSALIEGAHGVIVSGGAGTVVNHGAIKGVSAGVDLRVGGSVTNGAAGDTTALIDGYNGVVVEAGIGSVSNYGTIEGPGYNGAGVSLRGGGTVTNGAVGDIAARIEGNTGVIIGGGGSVTNFGTIEGLSATPGVDLAGGGALTNGSASDTTALIEGGAGVVVEAAGSVANFGTIEGGGLILFAGGAVTNGAIGDTTALIQGGVAVGRGAGSVINFGTILETGANNVGLSLGGGMVTNGGGADRTALISGYIGLYLNGSSTVTNLGTIMGTGGSSSGVSTAATAVTVTNFGTIEGSRYAVKFTATNDVLVVEAGCVFAGAIDGGGGGTLDLASGVGTLTGNLAGGTVTVSGSMATTPFSHFGTVEIGIGARFTTSGPVSLAAGQKLIDVGALTLSGPIVNTGEIGLVSLGAAASLTIGAAGATLSGGGRFILDDSALNLITGASPAATLTNIDNTLSGAGRLGGGSLSLVNEAKGVIVGSLGLALVIDTGSNPIVNAGRIVAKGAGGVTIASAVANSGVLEAAGGVLTVNGAVSGGGTGVVDGGRLDFASSFAQQVVFQAAGGILELDRSQSYTGRVVGFSKTGATSLDLRDIAFKSAGEATFSGTATSGTLTVTDGTHTAHITLIGDYRTSTFIASSDGHGGTTVVDPTAAAAPTAKPPSVHPLIAAMAGLGAGGASLEPGAAGLIHAPPTLIGPRVSMA